MFIIWLSYGLSLKMDLGTIGFGKGASSLVPLRAETRSPLQPLRSDKDCWCGTTAFAVTRSGANS